MKRSTTGLGIVVVLSRLPRRSREISRCLGCFHRERRIVRERTIDCGSSSRPSFRWEYPDRCHEKGRSMTTERRLLNVSFVCGAFALVSLLGLLSWPSIAYIRTVDIVRLIATGMCLGAALVALALFFVV